MIKHFADAKQVDKVKFYMMEPVNYAPCQVNKKRSTSFSDRPTAED